MNNWDRCSDYNSAPMKIYDTYKMTPHKCPVCEGRGIVDQNFYTKSTSSADAGNVSCRSCIRGIIFI